MSLSRKDLPVRASGEVIFVGPMETLSWWMGGVIEGIPWDGVLEVDDALWEKSSLELALGLVPSLTDAIELCRTTGSVRVHVTRAQ